MNASPMPVLPLVGSMSVVCKQAPQKGEQRVVLIGPAGCGCNSKHVRIDMHVCIDTSTRTLPGLIRPAFSASVTMAYPILQVRGQKWSIQ